VPSRRDKFGLKLPSTNLFHHHAHHRVGSRVEFLAQLGLVDLRLAQRAGGVTGDSHRAHETKDGASVEGVTGGKTPIVTQRLVEMTPAFRGLGGMHEHGPVSLAQLFPLGVCPRIEACSASQVKPIEKGPLVQGESSGLLDSFVEEVTEI
jgi:hypothetical protein